MCDRHFQDLCQDFKEIISSLELKCIGLFTIYLADTFILSDLQMHLTFCLKSQQ